MNFVKEIYRDYRKFLNGTVKLVAGIHTVKVKSLDQAIKVENITVEKAEE